jgi:hypothetical protein
MRRYKFPKERYTQKDLRLIFSERNIDELSIELDTSILLFNTEFGVRIRFIFIPVAFSYTKGDVFLSTRHPM